tara:strand:- start:233 stop:997 length:765 start_codon:yes stop_codon:yes gene_type:complete
LEKRGLAILSQTLTLEVLGPYGALLVYEGASAIDQAGYIQSMTTILIEANINIIYSSTFTSDLILCPQSQLQEAYDHIISGFDDVGHLRLGNSHVKEAYTGLAPKVEDGTGILQGPAVVSPVANGLRIVSVKRSTMESLMHAICRVLFFDNAPTDFISVTMTDDEVSLVGFKSALSTLPADIIEENSRSWSALQLTAGFGSSMVWSASDCLARANISIYYLSSSHDDYILIPEGNRVDALHCFENLGCNVSISP